MKIRSTRESTVQLKQPPPHLTTRNGQDAHTQTNTKNTIEADLTHGNEKK